MAKIFKNLQSTLRLLFINRPKPLEKPFNTIRTITLIYFGLYTIMMSGCFGSAESFVEYAMTGFTAMTGLSSLVLIAISYAFIPELFDLIDTFESGIESRKL